MDGRENAKVVSFHLRENDADHAPDSVIEPLAAPISSDLAKVGNSKNQSYKLENDSPSKHKHPPPPRNTPHSVSHSTPMAAVNRCPPELLSLICAHIYAAGLAPPTPSLDPLIHAEDVVPTALPSSYPAAHWPESAVRRTLASACLVNRAWYDAAKPWLWHKVEVRLPRSFMALVEELVGGDEEEVLDEENAALLVEQTIQDAEEVALAAHTLVEEQSLSPEELARELHGRLLATLGGPDGSIPPELLSPPATRDPSPRRLRAKSKSPARWKLMRTISNALQDVMEREHPGVYGASSF